MTLMANAKAKSRSQPARPARSARTGPAKAAAAGAADRCELCGARLTGSTLERFGHLRTAHRRYAQGLLLRLATPLLFLATIGALAVAGAPQWAYVVALALCGGVVVAGMRLARSERSGAGLRPAPSLAQSLRDGGFRFLLLPAVLLLLLLLSRFH